MNKDSNRFARLGDICKTTSGGTPSRTRKEYYGGNIPWVKSGELCDGVVTNIEESITEEGLKNSSAKIFPSGSLLIALYGATVGKLGILPREAATNQAVCGIFPREDVDTKYLFWYLRSIRAELIEKGQGGAQPNISQGIVKDILVPLQPFENQQKIVAEIEKQLSRLDESTIALKRIQANLKRYKAAVLKAAVEGKLTEQWRKDHPDVEPADQLLKRILAERRARWEAEELAKMQAKGIKPKDDSWKKKYKEPAGPDTANLPELPEGLVWATIDQIAECLDSKRIPINKKERATRLGQIPYYGANGQVGWIDDYLFDEPLVLVVEDETFTGREIPFSYKITGKSWVNNHAHVLRNTGAVSIDFLNYALSFYPFTPLTTGTTGRKKLTQAALITAPFSLPPIEEQLEIVAEIDRRLSVNEELESTIETSLKRADRLRQTMLKRIFGG